MHVEKPSGTSAAVTAFCSEKLEYRDHSLHVDGNGKITAGNGTLDHPRPNAFSLLQIDDCPGATEVCKRGCYVHNLEKHAPETHALYRHNSRQIRGILDDTRVDGHGTYANSWAGYLGWWINTHASRGFRWHVSGDVFSPKYARWIADVCRYSPHVRHWIYTRSHMPGTGMLAPLLPVATVNGGNLALNLSCDADNYVTARLVARQHGLRLCYMTVDGQVPPDLPEGSVIFPDYALRGGTTWGEDWFGELSPQYKSFVCPVDYHGKSETRRCGPCARCLR